MAVSILESMPILRLEQRNILQIPDMIAEKDLQN